MTKGNWYKETVARLQLLEVLPGLARETEVCRLDAERERLAREYEAADGALLRQIAAHLKNDGSGNWSRYIRDRRLPGQTTPHERMRISRGMHVDVMRFDRAAVYDQTHCFDCRELRYRCVCQTSEE